MYCFKVRLGCGVLGRRLARQGWRLGDAEQYTKRQGSLALTQRNKVVRCVVLCVTASPEARPPLMLPPSFGLSALTPSIGPLPGHPSSSSQRHRWGCCWLADRWRPAWAEWSGACACLCALSSVGAHPSVRSVLCALCALLTPLPSHCLPSECLCCVSFHCSPPVPLFPLHCRANCHNRQPRDGSQFGSAARTRTPSPRPASDFASVCD